MNKIRRFFRNELVITLLLLTIMLSIISGTIFVMARADKRRCEANGGKYIWEWTYASKCHLRGKE